MPIADCLKFDFNKKRLPGTDSLLYEVVFIKVLYSQTGKLIAAGTGIFTR
jgi:hypothetical protein